jgi:orotate phosphoribosyltransferase
VSESAGGRTALAEALFRIGALRFGKSTLPSGRAGSYFLDLRVVPSDPEAYRLAIEACRAVAMSFGEGSFDALAGVGTAGVTLSSPLAYLLKKPMLCVGDHRTERGLGQPVEGAVRPGWRTVVVGDAISTGASIRSAIEALRKAGCVVKDALVLVDRQESGKTSLANAGVRLASFVDVETLVEILFQGKRITKANYDAVVKQLR